MLKSAKQQLKHATTAQRPASTCFLLNQKQPNQPLCIWMATTGSSLGLLPQTGTGDVTFFPLSLSLFLHKHAHTRTHMLPPSHLPSPCLFPLVSPDRRAPQTVFTPPQALRHSYRAAGLQPFSLFMNQVQLKYIWAKDRWAAQRATKRKRRGWVLSCGCTH